MNGRIIQGDAATMLKTLPAESVDMCITSPPYFRLRDYGVEGQIGKEETIDEFLDALEAVFREVDRVLKPSGSCWINIGDTYSTATSQNNNPALSEKINKSRYAKKRVSEIPNKSLCFIPFRLAIRLQEKLGWICRNTVIWHKPNTLPQSIKDRFTVDFEYLFFFTKNERYYFKQQLEPLKGSSELRLRQDILNQKGSDRANGGMKKNGPMKAVASKFGPELQARTQHSWERSGGHSRYYDKDGKLLVNLAGRNKRCVWTIPLTPFSEAHFAVYPEGLIETPIKAACPDEVCMRCGTAKIPVYDEVQEEPDENYEGEAIKDYEASNAQNPSDVKRRTLLAMARKKILKGYQTCDCGDGFEPGIVLDPFIGAGTTGLVCEKLNRRWIGIELSPEFIKIAEKRLSIFKDQTRL